MDASLLTHNVAKLVELPPAVQSKLWTPAPERCRIR
ncbi:hypothetical protein H4696_008956 [Amycolatopsis lexingtonensis]|uniref:Uncharacterized protein n=1 Tax=Amycolatopsis lexingtonensis TaxID=218822 RepID=A0ABR9IFA6_9PSEU|nr:hypothetical protein [Amycolatopsis lexingtonensis]